MADNKISLKLNPPFETSSLLVKSSDSDWDHANVPIEQAKDALNS